MHLSQWPLGRVLAVCFAWFIFASVVFVLVPYRRAVAEMRAPSPDGVFALSAPLASLIGPVLLPPILFFVVWFISRRR